MEWDPIEEAEEYEIYLYNPDKGKYELKGNTRYSKYTLGYYEKFSQDHYYKIRAYSNSGIYKEAYGEFCDVTAKAVPGRPEKRQWSANILEQCRKCRRICRIPLRSPERTMGGSW